MHLWLCSALSPYRDLHDFEKNSLKVQMCRVLLIIYNRMQRFPDINLRQT